MKLFICQDKNRQDSAKSIMVIKFYWPRKTENKMNDILLEVPCELLMEIHLCNDSSSLSGILLNDLCGHMCDVTALLS